MVIPRLSEAEILAMARPAIQSLKPYVPGRSIEDVKAKYGLSEITKLGSNESALGANPKVMAALQAALPKMYLYPDGASRNLRQALADANGLSPDQVMAGNGSDEVMLILAAAFLNPGETVLVSENTFSEYEFCARVFDGKVVKIPLRDFRYDIDAFRKQLRLKPKLVFLCNPNNPTGSYFSHAELESLLRAAPPRTMVVVDEAYGEYATAPDFPRCLELMQDYPNLAVCRTFSKIHGMAGLRLGYGFAHPLVIREAARVKTPFNVNLPAQIAALAALKDKAFLRRSLRVNDRGRDYLEKQFRKLGVEFIPTQANFICFRSALPAADLCEILAGRGMIIRPLRSFGLDYWNRVTIGTPEQNRRFIGELGKVDSV